MSLQTNGQNDYINVSRGLITNASRFNKVGYNPAVSSTESTVWSEGTTAVSYAASATTPTLSSTSANDAAAGTGARTITLTGLDANFVSQSETITLNGTSAVTATKAYYRFTIIETATAGSTGSNVGTIYAGSGALTNGKPATIYQAMAPTFNRSLSAFATIPANTTGYLVRFFGSIDDGGGTGNVLTKLYIRTNGGVFKVVRLVAGDGFESEYQLPLALPVGTDVEARCSVDTGTALVNAEFELLYLQPN